MNPNELELEKKRKRKIIFRKTIFVSAIILGTVTGVLLYSRFIGTSGLIVKEYKIVNKKLPESFHGLKIVHLSDIHYGRTVKKKSSLKLLIK